MENNLLELRRINKLTQENLSEILNCSLASIKKYESFEIKLPIDSAKILSKKYNVTLDWIYCNDTQTPTTSMVDVLVALRKVFRISSATTRHGNDVVLQIDSRFKGFLADTAQLTRDYSNNPKREQAWFVQRMESIFEDHKQVLSEIFGEVDFNEVKIQEINSVEFISDYLGKDDVFAILSI